MQSKCAVYQMLELDMKIEDYWRDCNEKIRI
jgi:hypothetical protein